MERELIGVVAAARQTRDAVAFLKAVRHIVYGEQGYNSVHRIDDCELTSKRLCLRVSNRRTGKSVYTLSERFQTLRRVA